MLFLTLLSSNLPYIANILCSVLQDPGSSGENCWHISKVEVKTKQQRTPIVFLYSNWLPATVVKTLVRQVCHPP